MTTFFEKIFATYPVKTRRFLEIMPGFITWTVILLPIAGAFFFPVALAYFILFFDIYYCYKSFQLALVAYIASKKIKAVEQTNWLAKGSKLEHWDKVTHVLIIPNYKERIEKMRRTLQVLTQQTFPKERIFIVLAMEEREAEAKEKAEVLLKEFRHAFGEVIAVYHPDLPGETKGKSSNEAYAGRRMYERYYASKKADVKYATVTTADADAVFDKQFFAYFAYRFLTDAQPYNKFWQSAIVFYNNIWEVPSPTRIISFFGGLWRIGLLIQGDKLLTHATYSLSVRLLHDIGYWDVDVIPEDYRIFFKAFYQKAGQIWVEPLFMKTSMDAALSVGYINSLKNKYQQERRWSWGVSDNPLFIKWWFTVPNMPFLRKTLLQTNVLIDHLLWPVNWFIVTVAANIIPIVNPVFSRTSLGYSLPRLAGFILTSTFIALLIMIYIDYLNRPKHIYLPWYRKVLFPFEFILMPVVGFFLSALPALISHTQLMLGKRMEYKVTDKV